MAHIIGLAGLEIIYTARMCLAAASGPEQRAVDYLAREVPRCRGENCDAVRATYGRRTRDVHGAAHSRGGGDVKPAIGATRGSGACGR